MSKASELKRSYEQAAEYAGKVGRPESHLRSVGKIHRLVVATEICHQDSPSAKNYWEDPDFDTALAKVIQRNFRSLANEALALMHAEYVDARIAQKQSLLDQLKEIEALEAAKA